MVFTSFQFILVFLPLAFAGFVLLALVISRAVGLLD